jgi:Domain of unknown function (DUF4382)
MYGFPVWRRLPFIGLLIVILVISYAPATTQGTTTIRLAALSPPSIITHIYISVSSIELHGAGLPDAPGSWATISQSFPVVDLLSPANQSIAQTISSAMVHSGRYDAVKIFFTNSTLIISGTRTTETPINAPSPLNLNTTLLVSPNGTSDIFLFVAFDYTSLLSTTPTLSFILVRIS